MSYFVIPKTEEGGQKKVLVVDMTTNEILAMIYNELKIMNVHLSELSDLNITSVEEVEDDN